MDVAIHNAISQWAEPLSGVFSLGDLRLVLGDRTESALYKRLNKLAEAGALIKVKRGIYATPDASLVAISHRIEPEAYISTGTVLAKHALIGSVPARRVQAVKTGRPRAYRCEFGTIEHLSIGRHLYFGFEIVEGIRYATPEKAFLDVCYYTYRGKQFSFDPASDVNLSELNRRILTDYLERYDKRFVSYFNRIWSELQ